MANENMAQAVVPTLWYDIGIIPTPHGHNERGTENFVLTWSEYLG